MNIGTLIRKYRKNRKMTLKAVAEKASISEGFLSQVENDVNSPSVSTLIRICDALSVEAGDLLNQVSEKKKIVVIKRSDWDDVDLSHTGFATQRFFGPEDRTVIDSSVLVLEPGKSIPVRKNIKNGQEVLCVLKGEVELTLNDETYSLGESDTVHFWTNPKKQMITNNNSTISFVLWIGTL